MIHAQHLTRQLDLIPLETLGQEITIIGAGAIGSWVALSLAKAGFCNLTVYDDDHVTIENMSCQFYRLDQIGVAKVTALADMIESFTHVKINAHKKRLSDADRLKGIVISAVDSMASRKMIWEQAKAQRMRWLIDGRMGAETALLYTMSPVNDIDCKSYEKTLYSDADASPDRCTAKATIYTSNLIAGLICKAVKDLVTRSEYPRTAQWAIDKHDLYIAKGKQ